MTGESPLGPRRSAFTLVELLVVVAVIALLAAILVPMLRNAQKLVNDVACVSFLKGASTAYLTYSSDHDGICLNGGYQANGYPFFVSGMDKSVTEFLRPYFNRAWWDPAGNNPTKVNDPDSFFKGGIPWTNYGLGDTCHNSRWNGRWFDTPTNLQKEYGTREASLWMPVRLAELPNPSTTGMFFCREASEYYMGWFTGGMFITSSHTGYGPWPLHRNGKATNVARMDGSIRTYPWAELVTANVFYKDDVPETPADRLGCAREYLYSGWAPGDPQNKNSGWLDD